MSPFFHGPNGVFAVGFLFSDRLLGPASDRACKV